MPFFSTKKSTAIFAGLDDPFNFPTAKMSSTKSHHTKASHGRASSPDSGYASVDESALSPKSSPPTARRKLKKDGKGHWRMGSYEYQSEDNDEVAERTPILEQEGFEFPISATPTTESSLTTRSGAQPSTTGTSTGKIPDNEHTFKPNPRRTFTQICNEGPKKKQNWFERRVYGRAMQRREKSEGVSELQREMAPVLRRASPERGLVFEFETAGEGKSMSTPTTGKRSAQTLKQSPSPSPVQTQPHQSHTQTKVQKKEAAQRPTAGHRKGSTLLHPSPPPSSTDPSFSSSFPQPTTQPHTSLSSSRGDFGIKTVISGPSLERPGRGRSRKPSTLLHPSPPSRSCFSGTTATWTSTSTSTSSLVSPPSSSTALVVTNPLTAPTLSCSSLPHSRPESRTHSPLQSRSASPHDQHQDNPGAGDMHNALRSPRNRSQTPLRIPLSSTSQPAPTPLRIRISSGSGSGSGSGNGSSRGRGRGRKGSVLHSCFSEDEDEYSSSEECALEDLSSEDSSPETSRRQSSESGVSTVDSDESSTTTSKAESTQHEKTEKEADMLSISSLESVADAGARNEFVLARTGMIARAQRVRVVGLGARKELMV